jgi:mono/diheme cytochrome c family protein
MTRNRVLFALAVVLSAAASASLLGLSLAGGLVAGLFRNTSGLATIVTAGRLSAGLSLIGALTSMGLIAISVALLPGGWERKVLYVAPVFLLGLTAAGGLMMALGIGLVSLRKTRAAHLGAGAPAGPSSANVRGEIARAVVAVCTLGAVALVVMQFIPVPHTNPPVQTTVAWDSVETKDLFYRACADCHTNETTWPWYAALAPASWLTSADVNSARARFNISEPSNRGTFGGFENVNDIRQWIESGTMPPSDYLLLHPAARLSDAEKQQLIQGIQNSLR